MGQARFLCPGDHLSIPITVDSEFSIYITHSQSDVYLYSRFSQLENNIRLGTIPARPCRIYGHRGLSFRYGGALARLVSVADDTPSGIDGIRHRNAFWISFFQIKGPILCDGQPVSRRRGGTDHLRRRHLDRWLQRAYRYTSSIYRIESSLLLFFSRAVTGQHHSPLPI